jgi:hypothetical protein
MLTIVDPWKTPRRLESCIGYRVCLHPYISQLNLGRAVDALDPPSHRWAVEGLFACFTM